MDDHSNGRDRKEMRAGPIFGNRLNKPMVSLKSIDRRH